MPNRKTQLQMQYNTLTEKIQLITTKELNACFASARGDEHEDMFELMLIRHDLEDKRAAVLRQLNKPSLIKRIRKAVRK